MGELTNRHGKNPFAFLFAGAPSAADYQRFLMGGISTCVFLSLALASSSMAAAPAAPAPKPAAPAFPSKPSRYAGDHVDEFVAEMTQILAMRTRTTGPFGELQDLDAKPVESISQQITGKKSAEPSVALSEIVQLMVITTIIPGEKRFLIGSRSISQGEELPVTFQGKKQKIKVIQVSSDQIVFQNVATGETATRQLNKLPPGMTPGATESLVPGMQHASEEAPINLDPSSP